MVVASHCINSEDDVGSVAHDNINQPTKPLFSNNKVPGETVDPSLHPIDDE